jgi:hypothetical protein
VPMFISPCEIGKFLLKHFSPFPLGWTPMGSATYLKTCRIATQNIGKISIFRGLKGVGRQKFNLPWLPKCMPAESSSSATCLAHGGKISILCDLQITGRKKSIFRDLQC